MDVADHQEAVVVHDEGSEVSVDEETRTAHSPRSRGGDYSRIDSSDQSSFDGALDGDEFTRRAVDHEDGSSFLEGSVPQALEPKQLRSERGWKLFMLLPRLLLFRPSRDGNVHKSKLAGRFQDFTEGRWMHLLRSGGQCAEDASRAQCRKIRRHHEDDLERRAGRALS